MNWMTDFDDGLLLLNVTIHCLGFSRVSRRPGSMAVPIVTRGRAPKRRMAHLESYYAYKPETFRN